MILPLLFIPFSAFACLSLFASAFSDQPVPCSTSTPSSILSHRRRLLFQHGVPSCILLPICLSTSSPAFSIGEGAERILFNKKPTAPIEALLPAIQQRLLLEAALELLPNTSNHDSIELDSSTALLHLRSILPPLDDSPRFKNQNGSQNRQVLQKYAPDKVLRGEVVRGIQS